MKKIGIITLYGNSNYGNKLQNYALQEVAKKFGFDVETIAYKFEGKTNLDRIKYKILNLKSNLLNFKYIKRFINRNRNFKDFNHLIKYTKILKYNKIDKYNLRYDFIIAGSDQIWGPMAANIPILAFAEFSKKENNISYAASFGTDSIESKNIELYKKGLNNFEFISVREDKGKKIIKNILNIDVEILIDPTMLIPAKDWLKIAKKPKRMLKEDFILICFLGEFSERRKEQVKHYAQKNNLKIVELNRINIKEFYEIGPSEFLYYISNAKTILTDSFHVVVFSIIFKKDFWVFEREDSINMNSRIETLLNKFNLQNRIARENIDNMHIDYTNIDEVLEREKEKSYKFLKRALRLNEEKQ